MSYTIKKLAVMSGVSVRTLHFYDEVGLLKPAYVGANGYRHYEEPQVLMLQYEAHDPRLPEFMGGAIRVFAERELS